MELNIKVEKTSPIVRKLTVRVPAKVVSERFLRGLTEVQRSAHLKGFRPGHAPMAMIRKYYGEDLKHRLYHNLIDESLELATKQEKLKTVGNPKIESPEHQTGAGEHDHTLHEEKDLTYTATVEIFPELEVKNYKGIPLKREAVEVTDQEVKEQFERLLNSRAELVPASSGLADASGKVTSREIKKGDFVDLFFDGGVVKETGIEKMDGMKGSRLLEVGSGEFIPGFEDQLVGLRAGESKTFRIRFPEDYGVKDLSGKEAEFEVQVNEVKEKKLPELNEAFFKGFNASSESELKKIVKDELLKSKTEAADRKLRSEALEAILAKNPFEVPQSLVTAQSRMLAEEWTSELRRSGFNDEMIQSALSSELGEIKKRAEQQVKTSLMLENIADQENLNLTPEDISNEYKKVALNARMSEESVADFFKSNLSRRADLEFRLRQEKTIDFVMNQAKIK